MARRNKAERDRVLAIETKITDLIKQGYVENATDWRRGHLGASIMGHKCDRYLWLSFRWAAKPGHDGKQLRLFQRGHREEPWLAKDLEMAGIKVSLEDSDGEQYRISRGHIGGSADGICWGVPGQDSDVAHLLEFKTHNRKSFDYLKSKKVRSAKPEHFVQMQVYMAGLSLDHALYVAVCKDTDEIYVELVDFDGLYAGKYVERAEEIIAETGPPAKMDEEHPPCVYTSKDGTRWPCDFFDLCHGDAMPERSCRTCVDATPTLVDLEPVWTCSRLEMDLDINEQRTGCSEQMSIPPIVNADVAAVCNESRAVTYSFADGSTRTEE